MSDYDMSIHTNPDAREWARFYIECKAKSPDPASFDAEDNMIGWFANAMMAMHDHLTGQQVTVLPDGSAFFVADIEPLYTAASLASARADGVREGMTDAACDVLAERERQKLGEGWTAEHDDRHPDDALALAAAAYAYGATYSKELRAAGGRPNWWPWNAAWWKPTSRRRDLVKSGALVLAAIERIDRAAIRALINKNAGGDRG